MSAFKVIFFVIISSLLSHGGEALPPSTKLRVALEDADNRPYEYRENSRWTGYHIEVIENVLRRLNWEVEWIPIPWTMVYNALYTDKVDAVSFLMRTPERNESKVLFLPGNILTHFEIAVYSRTDSPKKINLRKKTVSDLTHYQVGVLQGGATERWLSAAHPEIILNRTAKDAIQLFQMLENNRVDFIIGREYVFNIAAAADPKIKKTLKRLKPSLLQAPAYIAFQNTERGRKLGEEFSQAYESFRESREFKNIKTKYDIP